MQSAAAGGAAKHRCWRRGKAPLLAARGAFVAHTAEVAGTGFMGAGAGGAVYGGGAGAGAYWAGGGSPTILRMPLREAAAIAPITAHGVGAGGSS